MISAHLPFPLSAPFPLKRRGAQGRSRGSGGAGLGPGRARLPRSARTQQGRAARRCPELLLLLAGLTNQFRLSRSSKPEGPGPRPAPRARVVCATPFPPSGPRPYPARAPGSLTCGPACRTTGMPQRGGDTVPLFPPPFQGCEGLVDPEMTSGSFLTPYARRQGNSGQSRPKATAVPARRDRPGAAAKELLPQ